MKKGRHTITFEKFSDAQAVALAQMGQSNSVITRECELSDGQVTYRLAKAKGIMGHAHGFRVQWRNGESDVVKRVRRDVLNILRADIQQTLPVQIVHVSEPTRK